jgi:OmpA-OmpF porin, OOP family
MTSPATFARFAILCHMPFHSGRRSALLLLWAVAPGARPGLAQDIKGAVDPPIVGRYEGSYVKEQSVRAFDRTAMAARLNERGQFESIAVEGRRTLTALQGPRGRSSLEIFTNYANALKSAGFRVLYTCSRSNCPPGLGPGGSAELRRPLAVLGDGSIEDQHYLVASRSVPAGTEYARIAAMGPSLPVVVVDIVQPAAMETRVKVVEAASLRGEIAQRGRVALYAVFFDFDRAELKPESKPQLEELAKYLRSDPGVSVFIAGHTDGKGKVDYNHDLSRRRAAAVMAALVSEHGIAAGRLSAYGVGPLAPLATNDTEEGRALNRRVEVVKRLE